MISAFGSAWLLADETACFISEGNSFDTALKIYKPFASLFTAEVELTELRNALVYKLKRVYFPAENRRLDIEEIRNFANKFIEA